VVGDRINHLAPVPVVLSPFIYSALSAFLMAHDEDIFIKSTPRKVIMGYKVGLIETLTNVVKPFEVFGLKSSQIVPTEDLFNNSFGFLNGKNATPLGPWEVHTGENSSKVFEAISFKNQRYMLLALLCSALLIIIVLIFNSDSSCPLSHPLSLK